METVIQVENSQQGDCLLTIKLYSDTTRQQRTFLNPFKLCRRAPEQRESVSLVKIMSEGLKAYLEHKIRQLATPTQ